MNAIQEGLFTGSLAAREGGMVTMPVSKYSVSLDQDVAGEIARRSEDRSTVITRDLSRYYWLLNQALPVLQEVLTLNEVGLICDALHRVQLQGGRPDAIRWVAEEVSSYLRFGPIDFLDQENSAREKPAATWGVDEEALYNKLKDLSPLETAALLDAVDRYWKRADNDEDVEVGDVLQATPDLFEGRQLTHEEQILRAAFSLVEEGKDAFTRDEIRQRIGVDRDTWLRGYTAIFQGMRADQPGGGVLVKYPGVFRQVSYGKHTLTPSGQRVMQRHSRS